jgi:putative transposase
MEGGIHHVTVRGDRREPLFMGEGDRRSFLRRYVKVVERHRWLPLAYCLMGNHVHLVVETPERTLGLGARDLFGAYAAEFNTRRDEGGHVFQGRFDSRLVPTDSYFAQLLRYVALNPVAAHLCERPDQWPWSSHRALLTGRGDDLATAARVEELLAVWGQSPWSRYADLFVADNPLALQYGAADPWSWRPPLGSLFATASRRDAITAAREHGYRLAEIADHLGVHESTVSRWARRDSPERCKKGA